MSDASELTKLNAFLDDEEVHSQMAKIKLANKNVLSTSPKEVGFDDKPEHPFRRSGKAFARI